MSPITFWPFTVVAAPFVSLPWALSDPLKNFTWSVSGVSGANLPLFAELTSHLPSSSFALFAPANRV